ncbi:prolyl 4-hydroxylase subunit alpha-2-like [Paramacrobiotus metropolitanus]|uniref:prolyl 4-hydroxylase subunit alpha-2-like n=1 Tax=Paramacrobiotus metropolitanus TaxID=2943436 RepID=UPI002445C27F|nr:prolyl 4-hydroxylase subunit alpha-2-like [Paramacrobiotus metropolitanus]
MRSQVFLNTLFGLFIIINNHHAAADVSSAVADMDAWIATEKVVLDILQRTLHEERRKLREAKRLKGRLSQLLEEGNERRPRNAFQHMKLWLTLDDVVSVISTDVFTEHYKLLEEERCVQTFPDKQEIDNYGEIFARLQLVYKIHPQDIAEGRIPGTRKTIPFTSEEAFLIGHQQAQSLLFNAAAAWLETALETYIEEPEGEKTGNVLDILNWLQLTIYQDTGNAVRALEYSLQMQEIDPEYWNLKDNIKVYENMINNLTAVQMEAFRNAPNATVSFNTGAVDPLSVSSADEAYRALCRGEERMDPGIRNRLKCHYQTYNNPYLLIQPVKVEQLYDDPQIIMFHSVLLETQASRIRQVGHHHLSRGRVAGGDVRGMVSNYRISKIAFLEESIDPVIAEVNRYIGHITNLDSSIAEDLQVNNYGIGGHYSSHYDFYTNVHDVFNLIAPMTNYEIWGDRLATFLLYMTDVEAGGATVFPRLNLTLFPAAGSAVFWYNKFKDLSPDPRTFHAGCPVLAGNKWISNKWIREKGQDKYRPCALQPDGVANLTNWLERFA